MSYRGKVKNVRWYRMERFAPGCDYPYYESYILADLYDSCHNRLSEDLYVDITDEVLDYYGRQRITKNLVNEVRNDLHNVWIDYYYDVDDDEDYLCGDLGDYLD